MILIAEDVGSKEFEEPLAALGLPVEITHLDFGDFAFMGRGERGAPLYIGIEYKKLGEFVQSIRTERFQGHQLYGMVDPDCGFDRRYLLIEGDFHNDDQGRAVVYRGRKPHPLLGAPNAVVLEQEILNIATRGGVPVIQKTTRKDVLRWIAATYYYWTDKDLDEHKSHLALYVPDMDSRLLRTPSDFRIAVKCMLPGIGYKSSGVVEQWCWDDQLGRASWARLRSRTEDEWAALEIPAKDGKVKRLGAKRAHDIINALK